MNPATPNDDHPDRSDGYTLEVLAEITGVSTQTILQYQEHGIIRSGSASDPPFGDEAIRALRRIEHLRDTCGLNLSGLKLLTGLLEELEQLRAELHARR